MNKVFRFGEHLIAAIEQVLRKWGVPTWRICIMVWDKDNLDANLIRYPDAVSEDEMRQIFEMMMSQPDVNPNSPTSNNHEAASES